MHKLNLLILSSALLLVLFLAGCGAGIDETEAIAIATDFVGTNVKFGVSEGTDGSDVTQVTIDVLEFELDESIQKWKVYLKATAVLDGEQKKNGILVLVDAKNGKPDQSLRTFDIGDYESGAVTGNN